MATRIATPANGVFESDVVVDILRLENSCGKEEKGWCEAV